MFSLLKIIFRKIFPSRQARRVAPWTAINGDKTLRLFYELDANSIVFDIGGYEGQWTSDIAAMYNCRIYIFEPIKEFFDNIKKRFARNPQIKVFNFGLAGASGQLPISLAAESSSIFKTTKASELVEVVDICEFLAKQNIAKIDLLKINIEGAEYDLLERLPECAWLNRIKNLQIQFHDFVPQAAERMKNIQKKLSQTHHLTYQYEFVWENWEINQEL